VPHHFKHAKRKMDAEDMRLILCFILPLTRTPVQGARGSARTRSSCDWGRWSMIHLSLAHLVRRFSDRALPLVMRHRR